MSEPKKVDRRKFIYAGLGAVALIAIGAAAYVAMNPPVVTQTTTVPTTSIVTTTVPTTSVVTSTVPTTSVAKVTMWKGPHTTDDPSVYAPLLEEFKKETGITAEFVSVPWDALSAKLSAAVASGTVCDVAYLPATWMYQYANMGALVELENLPGFDEIKSRPYIEASWGAGQFNGHQYGIPYLAGSVVLMYNKDIFEKAGVTKFPKTYDELIEIAKQIHNPEKGVFAIGMPVGSFASITHWCSSVLYAHGANVPLSFGKPIPGVGDNEMTLNTDAGVQAMNVMKKLWEYSHKGKLSRSEATDMFFAGKVGIIPHEAFTITMLPKYPNIRAGVFHFPDGPKGRFNYGESGYICIFKQTKNLDASWKFAKFITSKDANAAYCKASGLLPCDQEIKIPEFTSGPYADLYNVYIEAIGSGRTNMYALYGEELDRMEDDILLGGADIKQTLDKTAQDILLIIKASGFKI
jgi:ABC-type glycerol-3-phosphate transport system substrate-binding protein